jgi:membrane associated rhomboid family serine protease
MIPLKDDVPSRTFPIVNITFIVLNVIAFIIELSMGKRLDAFIQMYGVVPVKYFYEGFDFGGGNVHYFTTAERIVPLFTSMFLHGGWLHLIGNMLYLWIFGDNVEDRMGHLRYVFFYILCGLAASAAHILTNQRSPVPTVGASGAIAGVLGAYLMLYPRARVIVLIPIFVFMEVVQLPAVFVLGFWFVMQLFQGTLSLAAASTATGGVAWWAHIGGFVFGMLMIQIFKKRERYLVERDLWWRE